MDYSLDMPLKVENTDYCDRNGNVRLTFDMDIKIEKDAGTAEVDWCVSSFQTGDLLEPLYFQPVTEPEGTQCGLCYRYFSDRYAILKHNLTHLQVTIVNPVLYHCTLCAYYFTSKLSMECHVIRHNQSNTNTLSNNPKSHRTASVSNVLKNTFVSEDSSKAYQNRVPKLRDGMTNWLLNRPKSSKAFKSEDGTIAYKDGVSKLRDGMTDKTYKDRVPKLRDGMTNWLLYRPKSSKGFKSEDGTRAYKDRVSKLRDGMTDWLTNIPKSSKPTKDYLKDSNKSRLCNICHKTYTYKHWHAHMQDVHSGGSFTCEICGIVFKCERYLNRHLTKIHIGIQPRGAMKIDVKCDECGTMLNSLNALATHLRNVHSDTKHVCYICKSTLKCKSYLLAHMRRVHCNDGTKHECECGKSFRSKRYLMVHKRNSHLKKNKLDGKVEDVQLVD